MKKKTIKVKDLGKEFKYLCMIRWMLEDPERHWTYIRLLYAANVFSHLMDLIVQDLDVKAPYMTEQSVIQRMKTANKAFDGLVNELLKQSKECGIEEKFLDVFNSAYDSKELFISIINDIMFWGADKNNFRWIKLNEYIKDLVPKDNVEREKQEYFKALHEQYATIENDLKEVEKNEEKREFINACTTIILNDAKKKVKNKVKNNR